MPSRRDFGACLVSLFVGDLRSASASPSWLSDGRFRRHFRQIACKSGGTSGRIELGVAGSSLTIEPISSQSVLASKGRLPVRHW